MLISNVLIAARFEKASGSLPTHPFCLSALYFPNSNQIVQGRCCPSNLIDWPVVRVWEEGCGWALLPEGQISRRGEPLLGNRGPRSWRVAYEYSCFGAAVTRGAQAGVFWSFVSLWLQKGEGSKPCVCPLRFTTLWPIVEQFASPLAWKGTAELQEPSAAAGCLCWGAFWCILLAIPLSSEPWQKAPSSLYGHAAGAVLGDLCWELAASVENRLWHLSHTSVTFCPPQINIPNPQMYLFVFFFPLFLHNSPRKVGLHVGSGLLWIHSYISADLNLPRPAWIRLMLVCKSWNSSSSFPCGFKVMSPSCELWPNQHCYQSFWVVFLKLSVFDHKIIEDGNFNFYLKKKKKAFNIWPL